MKRLFENWNKFLKEDQPDTYEPWLQEYGISVEEYEQLKYQRQTEYGRTKNSTIVGLTIRPDGAVEAEWEDGLITSLQPRRVDYERD